MGDHLPSTNVGLSDRTNPLPTLGRLLRLSRAIVTWRSDSADQGHERTVTKWPSVTTPTVKGQFVVPAGADQESPSLRVRGLDPGLPFRSCPASFGTASPTDKDAHKDADELRDRLRDPLGRADGL